MSKIKVSELFPYLEMMLKDNWGYIYGTSGVKWTQAKQNNLPDDPKYDLSRKHGSKWIGHMVSDCSGVMVYIWKQFGLKIPHTSNGIARSYVGTMSKSHPKPGYAAFKYKQAENDYHHIGIVGKNGYTVYEAKGTIHGFVTSDVSSWDLFAPFKDVDYSNEKEEEKTVNPYAAVITGNKVRVRSGPGVTYKKIGEVNKGEKVTVTAITDNWSFCKINQNGNNYVGYIFSDYVEKDETPGGDDTENVLFNKKELQEIYDSLSVTIERLQDIHTTIRKVLK